MDLQLENDREQNDLMWRNVASDARSSQSDTESLFEGISVNSQCTSMLETATAGDSTLSDSFQYLFGGHDLLNTVISWEVDDFMNSNLLKGTMKCIPEIFGSINQWASCFYPFVLEELRCKLGRLDYTRADSIGVESAVRKSVPGEAIVKFAVSNDKKENMLRGVKCSICMMTDKCLGTPSYFLAVIQYPSKTLTLKTKEIQTSYDVKFLDSDASRKFIDAGGRNWAAILLKVSTAGAVNVCNALQRQRVPSFVSDILTGRPTYCFKLDKDAKSIGDLDKAEVLIDSLNSSQQDAIRNVLNVGRVGVPSIQIIKGPPGTGKTSVLTKLIQCLVASKLRVHAAAATNVAACGLARKYLEAAPKSLRNIVLIGHPDRLGIDEESDGPLLSIHFGTRVDRLVMYYGRYCESKSVLLTIFDSVGHSQEASFDVDRENVKVVFDDFRENVRVMFDALTFLINNAPKDTMRYSEILESESVKVSFAALKALSQDVFEDWIAGCADERCLPIIDSVTEIHACLLIFSIAEIDCTIELKVLQEADVIFSTVSVAGRALLQKVQVDVAIVDEATQMVEAETALMLRSTLKCLVLAGDDKQLPATVSSSTAKAFAYDRSLFDRLLGHDYECSLLRVQYRMIPAISSWPTRQFYGGKVEDGPNVKSPSYKKVWHKEFPPLCVYNTKDGNEEKHNMGSWYNKAQASTVRRLVSRFKQISAEENEPISVGVISPYSQQVIILSNLKEDKNSSGFSVRVCSIDGFQGQECDVIILTTVRSNTHGNIGFLSDLRRLNVGITRAKYSLIVVCDAQTLKKNDTWKDFLNMAHDGGLIHNIVKKKVCKDLTKKSGKRSESIIELENDDVILPWEVVFEKDFQTTLNKLSSPLQTAIRERVKNIRNGKWPKLEKKSPLVEAQFKDIVHVFRVQCVQTVYLVWSVDIKQSRNIDIQRIKLWSVLPEDKLLGSIRMVNITLRNYSDAHVQRCAAKHTSDDDKKKYVPLGWKYDPDFVWYRKQEVATDSGTAEGEEDDLD